MTRPAELSRRRLLKRLALGVSLASLAAPRLRAVLAADAQLLPVSAPEAQAVKYVEDARQVKEAQPDSSCANCALYQGTYGSTQGPCQLFTGKLVKAAGWCTSWAPQM